MSFISKRAACSTLMVLTSFAASHAFAGSQGQGPSLKDKDLATPGSSYVFSISAGPVWAVNLKNQSFYLEPELEKMFTVNNHTNTLADGELFFGVQRDLSTRFQGQLGLAIALTSSASFSGDIWDDANPLFNNYIYSYRAQHTHVAVKAKVLTDVGHYFKPYVSASAGAGFNYLSSYSSISTNLEAAPVPNFRSHTQTALTYTVGAGIERTLSNHWQAGLGYEFADWGPGHLSRGPGQTTAHGVSFNHLWTNGLMFNITYLA